MYTLPSLRFYIATEYPTLRMHRVVLRAFTFNNEFWFLIQFSDSFHECCQSDPCFTHLVEYFIVFLINDFLFIIACAKERNSVPGCCPVFSHGCPRIYLKNFQFLANLQSCRMSIKFASSAHLYIPLFDKPVQFWLKQTKITDVLDGELHTSLRGSFSISNIGFQDLLRVTKSLVLSFLKIKSKNIFKWGAYKLTTQLQIGRP
jgi:hypothetical protein